MNVVSQPNTVVTCPSHNRASEVVVKKPHRRQRYQSHNDYLSVDDHSCRSSASTATTVSSSTVSKASSSSSFCKNSSTKEKRRSTFGRIRNGLDLLRGIPLRDECITTEEEQEEYLFDKKMDILTKNPTMFQDFQNRVWMKGFATSVGIRLTLYEFFSDMRIAEILEDIQEEDMEEDEDEEKPRRLGIFSSFGYSKSKPEEVAKPRSRKLSSVRSNRRSSTTPDHDDEGSSIFSLDSVGFSLPSHLESTDYDNGDDVSSVGVDTISGLSVAAGSSPPTSLRSLNAPPVSFSSLTSHPCSMRSLTSRQNSNRSMDGGDIGQPDSMRSIKSASTNECFGQSPPSIRSLMEDREGLHKWGSQRSLYDSHEAQQEEFDFGEMSGI